MAQGNNYPRGNSYNNGYNRNDDFRFNIKESIAVISEGKRESGWKKEVNLVEWNGNPGKIDIREWDPDHTKMGRGVTLTEEEAEFLALVLSRRYGLKNGKDAQRDAAPDNVQPAADDGPAMPPLNREGSEDSCGECAEGEEEIPFEKLQS